MTQDTTKQGTSAAQSKEADKKLKKISSDVDYLETVKQALGSTVSLPNFESAGDRPVGAALSMAYSFGYSLGDLSSTANLLNDLLKELNAVQNPGSSFCKVTKIQKDEQSPNPDPSNKEIALGCFRKSPLLKSISDTKDDSYDAMTLIQNGFNIINELSKPADPAECINPYFDQFFNLIPIQFIITKYIRDLLKDALGELTDQKVTEQLKDLPCGSELIKTYTNSLDLPEIPWPLFKIPALPTIPNINLYTVIRKIIIEAVCYAVCFGFTKLIIWATAEINKLLNDLFDENSMMAGSTSEFQAGLLGKIDLNFEISDEILEQAIVQNKIGISKEYYAAIRPIAKKEKLDEGKILIRKYFNAIYDYLSETFQKQVYDPQAKTYVLKDSKRELGTKELIYLMMGEYNCFTIQDLLAIGTKTIDGTEKTAAIFEKLELNTEQKINTFFKFIGGSINPIEIVTKLKNPACPANPCEEIVLDGIKSRIGELCEVLNLNKSGLPPIPIDKLLKSTGLDKLFNEGIKKQFEQLKNDYLISLGYPSLENFKFTQDITPFLPKETGKLSDYTLWNNKIIDNENIFKNYFLRGGPSLVWKYDNFDLNKNLSGNTLEDVCGEEETFEETFTYIFNDIFKQKIGEINKFSENQKEVYKQNFTEEVKLIYESRPPKK